MAQDPFAKYEIKKTKQKEEDPFAQYEIAPSEPLESEPVDDFSQYAISPPTKSPEEFNDLERQVIGLEQEEPSFLQRIYSGLTDPLVDIRSGIGREATEAFAEENPLIGKPLNFAADVLSGLSSPISLATAGSFGLGLPTVGKALAIPTALHGGEQLFNPESSMAERISGGLELGGSLLGMRSGGKPRLDIPDIPPVFGGINKPKMKINTDFEGTFSPIDNPSVIVDESGTQIAGPLDTRFQSAMPEPEVKPGGFREKAIDVMNVPRAIQSSMDLSAPFRQGLGLITTKPWWTSWDDMIKAVGSDEAFNTIMKEVIDRPNFTPNVVNGKIGKSFAEESGLYLGKLDNQLAGREESMMSTLAEKIPGVRASNRGYTAFLNKLRADNFDNMIAQAEKAGLDPKKNLVLSRQIAEFINNASGRGSLGSLEKVAGELNATFFSPRLISSRLAMMNPVNYVNKEPMVRKQYLRSMMGLAGAWTTMAGLAKAAGADVSLDPTNPDFGKIKIGDTRLDPAGGFQQYLVLMSKALAGGKTSSTNLTNERDILGQQKGKFTPYGEKYGSATLGSDVVDFVRNRLAPVPRFVTDVMFQDRNRPFNFADESLRLFTPIILQDLSELIQEDPGNLPTMIPSALGIGSQTYGKRPNSVMFPILK